MKTAIGDALPDSRMAVDVADDHARAGVWISKNMVYSLRFLGLTLRKVKLNLLVDSRNVLANRHGDEPVSDLLNSDPQIDGAYVSSLPFTNDPPKKVVFHDGVIQYTPYVFGHYLLKIQGTFDDYLSNFSSKSRATLRRKVRKLAAASGGEVDWREYRSVEEMNDFYRLASPISENTYQQRLLDAGMPQTENFYQEMINRAEAGRVRGYLLFIEDSAVAYMYGPVDHGQVMAYSYVGYDQAFSKLSPGTVLMFKVLEHLFDQGEIKVFDFEEGDGAHKASFSSERLTSASVYYFKPGMKTIAVVIFDQILIKLSNGIKSLLKLFRVDSWFKTLLRQRFRA